MKNLILTTLLALPIFLFGQEEFTLKGKVSGLPTEAKIYMQYDDAGNRMVDSAVIDKGEFVFHGIVSEPSQAYLLLSRDGTPFRELTDPEVNVVYLSKGVITFEGDDFPNIQATGTALNEEFAQYRSATQVVQDQMRALDEEYQAAPEDKQNDQAFIAGLQERAEKIFALQNEVNENFVKDNPKSYITLGLIEELVGPNNVQEYAKAFGSLPASYKNSVRGKRLNDRIQSLIKLGVGEVAPDFTLPDTAGNPLTLSSLRGQYVLVDFWASWCGPCRRENPHVVAAYNQFKDKGFTVLGVSLDQPDGREDWMQAIADDQLAQWPHVSDLQGWQSEVVGMYAITGIPQNYLLDREGKIVASNLRGDALIEKLSEVLK